MTHTLDVQKFTVDFDKKNRIKAIVYGPKFPSTSITIDKKEFTKTWKTAGESTVVNIKGLDKDLSILIHDVQTNVVTGEVIHADLYVVEKGKKVKVSIPLVFAGISPAVKAHGANLVKVLHEIEIEADATELPHDIQVDISTLENIDDHILVSDLKVSSSVKIITDKDEVVATATRQVEEKEDAVVFDASAIAVSEKKGKKEEVE